VNDVVDAFNLKSMGSFDKKAILTWVKGYLKVHTPRRSAYFLERQMEFRARIFDTYHSSKAGSKASD